MTLAQLHASVTTARLIMGNLQTRTKDEKDYFLIDEAIKQLCHVEWEIENGRFENVPGRVSGQTEEQ